MDLYKANIINIVFLNIIFWKNLVADRLGCDEFLLDSVVLVARYSTNCSLNLIHITCSSQRFAMPHFAPIILLHIFSYQ